MQQCKEQVKQHSNVGVDSGRLREMGVSRKGSSRRSLGIVRLCVASLLGCNNSSSTTVAGFVVPYFSRIHLYEYRDVIQVVSRTTGLCSVEEDERRRRRRKSEDGVMRRFHAIEFDGQPVVSAASSATSNAGFSSSTRGSSSSAGQNEEDYSDGYDVTSKYNPPVLNRKNVIRSSSSSLSSSNTNDSDSSSQEDGYDVTSKYNPSPGHSVAGNKSRRNRVAPKYDDGGNNNDHPSTSLDDSYDVTSKYNPPVQNRNKVSASGHSAITHSTNNNSNYNSNNSNNNNNSNNKNNKNNISYDGNHIDGYDVTSKYNPPPGKRSYNSAKNAHNVKNSINLDKGDNSDNRYNNDNSNSNSNKPIIQQKLTSLSTDPFDDGIHRRRQEMKEKKGTKATKNDYDLRNPTSSSRRRSQQFSSLSSGSSWATSSSASTAPTKAKVQNDYILNNNDNNDNSGNHRTIKPSNALNENKTKRKQQAWTTTLLPTDGIIVHSVLECLGSGSYGTVHKLLLQDGSVVVGKRPWTRAELVEQRQQNKQRKTIDNSRAEMNPTRTKTTDADNLDQYDYDDKARRCYDYWMMENHCYQKLQNKQQQPTSTTSQGISNGYSHFPNYLGTCRDGIWMLLSDLAVPPRAGGGFLTYDDDNSKKNYGKFENDGDSSFSWEDDDDSNNHNNNNGYRVRSLGDYMELDRLEHTERQRQQPQNPSYQQFNNNYISESNYIDDNHHHHHLYYTSQALGTTSLCETLDVIMTQLLDMMTCLHEQQIVHRDVKPSNLLIAATATKMTNRRNNNGNNLDSSSRLVLIDFGSAMDLSPSYIRQQRQKRPGRRTNTNKVKGKREDPSFISRFLLRNANDEDVVAVSPIYSAPEIFLTDRGDDIETNLKFDVFSVALIYCQLLFQYLDERTDSGFRQELGNVYNWNLDLWLKSMLHHKIQPALLNDALDVLEQRLGLWRLLQAMLQPNPKLRITSFEAKRQWELILERSKNNLYDDDGNILKQREYGHDNDDDDAKSIDGPYLREVLISRQQCYIPNFSSAPFAQPSVYEINTPPERSGVDISGGDYVLGFQGTQRSTMSNVKTVLPTLHLRPLHYVATFSRSEPAGIVLSEADVEEDEEDNSYDDQKKAMWKLATSDACAGDVFVRDIIPGGQAEKLGVIDIGDRLHGVGELGVHSGGFERAVALIQDQPSESKYVTLHFDRKPAAAASAASAAGITAPTITDINPFWTPRSEKSTQFTKDNTRTSIRVIDQGAWMSKGQRSTQEDAFILDEVHLDNSEFSSDSFVLAGVFDGHLGPASSAFVQDQFPKIFRDELQLASSLSSSSTSVSSLASRSDEAAASLLSQVVDRSWDIVVKAYQESCSIDDECIAEYDPVEGTLMANTASRNAVAGTTASVFIVDCSSGYVAALNCGDSRGIIIDDRIDDTAIIFQTVDHTPLAEYERFERGIERGYAYSLPQCTVNTWRIPVGDYGYAVARSLEGPFATLKGIISIPDIVLIPISSTANMSSEKILFVATDGFWEVIDTEEAAKLISKLKNDQQYRYSANDIAKILCSMAVERGSSDNVSTVLVFLQ